MKNYKLILFLLIINLLLVSSPVLATEDLSAGNLIHGATLSFISDMARFTGLIFLPAIEKIYSSEIIQQAITGISKNSKTLKQGLFTQDARNFTAGLIEGIKTNFFKNNQDGKQQ